MQLDEFTRKNLQDAPRMKAQLKGCANPQEVDKLPDSLYEIVHRGVSRFSAYLMPSACLS